MSVPKISIVMNTIKERPSYLQAAIASCLAQEDVDVQLVISTVKGDPSLAIAEKFSGIVTVINDRPDIYEQLNKALGYVKGDWFTYASGNDIMLPTKCIAEISKCGLTCGVCYSAFYVCDAHLKVMRTRTAPSPYRIKKHMGRNNFVSDCSTVSVELLKKYMPFRGRFGNHAFHDFWLRIAEGEGESVFVYNPKPTWKYRVTSSSSHIKRKKDPHLQTENKRLQSMMLLNHVNKYKM